MSILPINLTSPLFAPLHSQILVLVEEFDRSLERALLASLGLRVALSTTRLISNPRREACWPI